MEERLAKVEKLAGTIEYVPGKVWTESDLYKHSTNKPTAGAQHDTPLKKGEHPLQLYSLGTPNGVKVTILLEEIADRNPGFEYDAWKIGLGGDQFGQGFVDANPNSKIPALLDYSSLSYDGKPLRVFESAAIMLHVSEKFGDGFGIPKDPRKKAECMSWLFWQIGSAPYLGGGFGHFYNYAPVKIEYAINRFSMEAKRQLDVLDKHLATNEYICGDEYSLADMAIWPWYGNLVLGRLYGASEYLDTDSYKNVNRWAHQIGSRPAVIRGRKVNRTWGDKSDQLIERHHRSDFETKTQDKVE